MELLTELVKFADALDKQGLTDLANQLDALVIEAAQKEKKDKQLAVYNPEDNTWTVTMRFPPMDYYKREDLVNSYCTQELGPGHISPRKADWDFEPTPNTLKFIWVPSNGQASKAASGSLPPAISSDVVDSLSKIADELDNAGATDLADKIDGLIQGV